MSRRTDISEDSKHFAVSTVSVRRDGPVRLGDRHRLAVWQDGVARTCPLPTHGDIVVGRTKDAEIVIPSAAASRRHARLSVAPRIVCISDLGSRNGTRVNGELLHGELLLEYGDIITFGDVLAVLEEDRSPPAHVEPSDGVNVQIGDRSVSIADQIMIQVYAQLQRLAQSDISVLLVGETGAGKDVAASAIHFRSRRREGPFVSINCAAVPDALAESELFGYQRGAFTGAVRDKPGLLEAASTGTVFLDEVGDLSPSAQAKLLRAVETRQVTRIGALTSRPIDIRLVAATHRDLAAEVSAGRFRQDLYYRITAALLPIPPLRARPKELRLLARQFLDHACSALEREPLALSEEALQRLEQHRWPGNVRELKNLMDYIAATVETGPVLPDHFGEHLGARVLAAQIESHSGPGFASLREARGEFERRNIEAAMAETGGNKTKAAKLLGIPLRTFMEKVKRMRAAPRS